MFYKKKKYNTCESNEGSLNKKIFTTRGKSILLPLLLPSSQEARKIGEQQILYFLPQQAIKNKPFGSKSDNLVIVRVATNRGGSSTIQQLSVNPVLSLPTVSNLAEFLS